MKKKIAIICSTSMSINAFWLDHLNTLSNFYEIDIITKDTNNIATDVCINKIEINFSRKINVLNDLLILFVLFFYLYKKRYDITLSLSPKAGLLTAITSSLLRKKRRIHYFTGQIWVNKNFLTKLFYKFIDIIISKLSTNILVDSNSQRKYLLKNKIISKNKSQVLGSGSISGVNMNKFKYNFEDNIYIRNKYNINLENYNILFLGRINREKGILLLIEAVKRITKYYKNITLMLVGKIEDDSIKVINKNKKYINIKLINHTKRPEMYINACDLLCLPSYREGFGKVVIEAASCGKFSLVSNIYGLKDSFIKNKTGISFDLYDNNSFEQKIKYCYENKSHLSKMDIECREFVKKNFDNNFVTQNLLKFLNSI